MTLGLGIPEIDAQGRFLEADYGELSVVSLYMPSGTTGEEAQERKYAFMDRFLPRLAGMRACGREFVICGGWNIAHREIDVKNWKSNEKTTGFLPCDRSLAGPLHVVGAVGERARAQHRLAHRLPGGDPRHRAARAQGGDLHRGSVLRPRAGGHRLRLRIVRK